MIENIKPNNESYWEQKIDEMEIDSKKRQAEENKQDKFFVETVLEYGDDSGTTDARMLHLDVPSKEVQDGAEHLLDRFGGWMSLEDAAKLSTASKEHLQRWIDEDLLPRKERYYQSNITKKEGDKKFWEKAGLPL